MALYLFYEVTENINFIDCNSIVLIYKRLLINLYTFKFIFLLYGLSENLGYSGPIAVLIFGVVLANSKMSKTSSPLGKHANIEITGKKKKKPRVGEAGDGFATWACMNLRQLKV